MKIIEQGYIDVSKLNPNNKVYFIRLDPEDLSITLNQILLELRTLSWLNKFKFEPLKNAYELRAKSTCDYLEKVLLDDNNTTTLKETAGEYIVSNLSKKSLVENLNHEDIPLMELLGRKKSNNPGFDFYTEDNTILVAGEAKYLTGLNAYSNSLKQINQFISDNKHIQDIPLLLNFTKQESLVNLNNNKFSVCAAFSTTNISTEDLLDNICENKHFKQCISSYNIFLVAVDMYGN